MVFDAATQRVVMIEKGLGLDISTVVHVWTVEGGGPPAPSKKYLEFLPLLLLLAWPGRLCSRLFGRMRSLPRWQNPILVWLFCLLQRISACFNPFLKRGRCCYKIRKRFPFALRCEFNPVLNY